jgi:hypothetical protein
VIIKKKCQTRYFPERNQNDIKPSGIFSRKKQAYETYTGKYLHQRAQNSAQAALNHSARSAPPFRSFFPDRILFLQCPSWYGSGYHGTHQTSIDKKDNDKIFYICNKSPLEWKVIPQLLIKDKNTQNDSPSDWHNPASETQRMHHGRFRRRISPAHPLFHL